MPGLKKQAERSGSFTFRVSDVVEVPLRGTMLRLRLVDGAPSLADLSVGERLRLSDLTGAEREVRIRAHTVTGGKPSQQRLDRTREFDVLIEHEADGATPIEIGWMAAGPVA